MARRSYSKLSSLPAWGIFDGTGKLLATIRAEDLETARGLFLAHGYRNFDGRMTIGRVGQS